MAVENPIDPNNLTVNAAPIKTETFPESLPNGFANGDVFNQLMNKPAPAIAPISADVASPPLKTSSSMDQLTDSFSKIDVASLKSSQNPLENFTPNQAALLDHILTNSGPNAQFKIDPVAQRKLELAKTRIEQDQKALGKISAYYPPTAAPDSLSSATLAGESLSKPFSTFFGFITNGEKQLYGIEQELLAFGGSSGQNLSPTDMLRLQLKMSHVSQQLELFTGMLNKGLESSKTVLNTQI